MKVKVGSVIIGFIMICIGIAALAGQTPVFGIHPIVWFILGAMLICSDSAWESWPAPSAATARARAPAKKPSRATHQVKGLPHAKFPKVRKIQRKRLLPPKRKPAKPPQATRQAKTSPDKTQAQPPNN